MQTPDLASLRLAVFDQIVLLEDARNAFLEAYRDTTDWPVFLENREPPTERNRLALREAACGVLTTFHYTDEQQPIDTLRRRGLVAIPVDLESLVIELNKAKAALKKTMKDLRDAWPNAHPERDTETAAGLNDFAKRCEAYDTTLRRQANARLNLLQTYRQVVVLPRDTRSVTFTESRFSTKSKIIAFSDAEARLRSLGNDAGIRDQLATLARLRQTHPDHKLVITKPGAKHWRANISLGPQEKWYQVKAHSPLLVVRDSAEQPLPATNLNQEKPRVRQRRTDRRNAAVVLPAIDAYLSAESNA